MGRDQSLHAQLNSRSLRACKKHSCCNLERGRRRSIMNVLLGAMLVTLSPMSMFLFCGSTINIIVEAAFLVIGAFNIFSGLRSYG